MSSHLKVSGPPLYTRTQKTTRAGAETIGGETTFLESHPETNLHSNENTTWSTTPGQEEVWDDPGFPEVSESRLV